MAAFDLNDFSSQSPLSGANLNVSAQQSGPGYMPQTKIENIISFKIYDSCRQQDCLDFDEIGPARAAENVTIGGRQISEGEVIVPPTDAAAVTIDCVQIARIVIVDKVENCFRKGYWDVDLKYVIEYRLVFRNSDADIISVVRACSIFNRKVSLFGSEGCDLFISTDLLGGNGMFQGEPFILAEGKAIALNSSLIYDRHRNDFQGSEERSNNSFAVDVTLGLFSIVKLFRLVDLQVESRGFSIPEECEEICPMNPCDYFDRLDFPMDLFAPPQKPEFVAGISSNIPSYRNVDHDGGCGKCHDDKDDYECGKKY